MESNQLNDMVQAIRAITQVMGDGIKEAKPSEIINRDIVRKSILSTSEIFKGDVFTDKNVGIKRTDKGSSPTKYWDLIGKNSDRNYRKG